MFVERPARAWSLQASDGRAPAPAQNSREIVRAARGTVP